MKIMKKIVWGFGALFFAALTMAGCGDEDAPKLEDLQRTVTVEQTEGQTQDQEASESLKEKEALMETYQAVLRGTQEFVDSLTGESLDISRVREMVTPDTEIAITPGRFSMVDFDGDGTPEVILDLVLNGEYSYGCLILHCEEDTVYGYVFSVRELNELKVDGSFLASGGAADVGICRISFSGQEYFVDKFTYSESHYDMSNNLNISCYVDGQEATQAEYDAAYRKWEELPGVAWYDFTETNIEDLNEDYVQGNAGTGNGDKNSPQNAENTNSAAATDGTGISLEGQISDQSFTVELDSWGEVTFASFEPEYRTKEGANGQVMFGDVRFGLVKDGEIIYNFPGYNENGRYSQQFDQVVAVSFQDYDEDGRADILIIIEYVGTQGANTDVPFREARVYTQEDGETVFKIDNLLSEYLVYYTDSMSEMYDGIESYAKCYSVATSKTAWAVERFAREARRYILGGDFEGLSDIISFPITVDGTVYQDREAFLKAGFVENPNQDFLEELRNETCENLFANYQGIMMGNGLVWFAELSNTDNSSAEGLKITGINGITPQ